MNMDGRSLLDGVVIPVITPMDAERHADPGRMERLLTGLAGASVGKIMLFGSNGEGPALGTGELGEIAAHATRTWRQLVPGGVVIVNVSGVATANALERAAAALPAEPDALLLGPPSFFRHRRQELVLHYRAFQGLDFPVVAYNSPVYSGNDLDLEVVGDLAELDFVVGIKDSSRAEGRIGGLAAIAAARGGFGVSQGDESAMVIGLRDGADGITPGIGNLAPSVVLDLFAAVRAGDDDRARALQERGLELIGIHRIRPGIPAIKAALALRGLCEPYTSLPFIPYSEQETAKLAAYLAPWESDLVGSVR